MLEEEREISYLTVFESSLQLTFHCLKSCQKKSRYITGPEKVNESYSVHYFYKKCTAHYPVGFFGKNYWSPIVVKIRRQYSFEISMHKKMIDKLCSNQCFLLVCVCRLQSIFFELQWVFFCFFSKKNFNASCLVLVVLSLENYQ